MNNPAFHLQEFFKCYKDREDAYRLALKFSENEQKEYNRLFDEFVNANSNKKTSTKVKGETLENLVEYIFNTSPLFMVAKNVRTSTNELDLLVTLSSMGILFEHEGFLKIPYPFICECKNYNKKVDVTWVGKLYSLVTTSNKNLGIIFSFHGLSGKGWHNAHGLTKKICLSTNNDILILDFSLKDFEAMKDGEVFINIINRKIFQLMNDTSFEFQPHELNGCFS